jgi:two-component system probable response regulator PhcQ
MEQLYDYNRFAILYVDDTQESLKSFVLAFEDQFRILTASNAADGLKLLEQHKDEIGLLMTDQRMPGEKGVWLLERARQLRPRIVRILVTAYTDMEAAIAAVNTGAIYKYIQKPWDPPMLETTIKRALEFFLVQRERDELLQEKLSVLHNMMIADRMVSLGLLAAGLSHHIRNSLQAIRTFVDLAPAKMAEEKMDLAGLRNPDFWKEYYENVQQQIIRINNMLNDLWTASEKPSFEFSDVVQLRQVIDHTLEGLKTLMDSKGVSIENRVPENLPEMRVDKVRFCRLFELLLKDEAASLPSGSRIVLAASLAESANHKPEIQVQVSDNGPGLPKEAFASCSIRSWCGGHPMEGIHLMACYFIVHHHGGRIDARSHEGQGTTFTLRFPTDPREIPPAHTEHDFLQKVVLNESLWQKLISSE